jgi:hypothetical protein
MPTFKDLVKHAVKKSEKLFHKTINTY